jgi:coenzyme F420-reducing hydrogenase beta subunit
MLTILNDISFEISKCQQCGTCLFVCPVNAISATRTTIGLNEITINNETCIRCLKCVNVCPANKKVVSDASLNSLNKRDYYLVYNQNIEIRKNASSGGVARTLLVEGLKSGIIDGAYTLKQTSTYPFCEGEFYHKNNIPDYQDIPNSVYHSVLVNQNLNRIAKTNRLMVIGTGCQLKGIEHVLKGKFNELIKVCIFCKQQKTFESTRFLAKIMGTKVSMDKHFTFNYRGSGWPGVVKINHSELDWDIAARIPFGRRLWTVPGCNICSNPFGEEVDLTLMDPWKIEKESGLGKTLTIVHTKAGEALLKSLSNLLFEVKSYSEIEDAMDLKDIRRKQQLIPYFRGEKCDPKIRIAGKLEEFQRWYLSRIVNLLPRMPVAFYKILNKIPDLRNLILR